MNLKGKTVVITGATGGMGRELMKVLEETGARLVLISKNNSDFTKPPETLKFAKKVSDENRTVDVLINAAGIGVYKKLKDLTEEEWSNSLAVNTTAPLLMIKGLLPSLMRSKKPVVLSLGSGMGKIAVKGRVAYTASKFALRGMHLSLSKGFKNTKLKFILLTLGSVLTPFGPLSLEDKKNLSKKGKKYLDPTWVAEKIVRIIENEQFEDEITIYPSHYFEESKK